MENRWTIAKVGKLFMSNALIISVILFVLSMAFAPAFSSFTAQLVKGSIGITLFYLFDKYALKEVDTIEELKKGNIAYSIFLVCIAGIIIAGIISS